MPNRIVREGILTSEAVNTLSWAAEVFFRRLMSVMDDFGRFDGRAVILRTTLYPLQLEKVSGSDIGKWIGECCEAGLVRLYSVENRPYLVVYKVDKARAARSKWPDPPPIDSTCVHVRADASKCPVFDIVVEGDIESSAMAGKGLPEPPKKREPDPIWDAVAAIWFNGSVAQPHAKRVGKIVRDLKLLNATPDEIRAKRAAHLKKWSDIDVTPESVVKHWCSLIPKVAVTKGIEKIRTGSVMQQTEQWRREQEAERAALQKQPPPASNLASLLPGGGA